MLEPIGPAQLKIFLDEEMARIICVVRRREVKGEFIPLSEVMTLEEMIAYDFSLTLDRRIVFYSQESDIEEQIINNFTSRENPEEQELYLLHGGTASWRGAGFESVVQSGIGQSLGSSLRFTIEQQVGMGMGGLILIFSLLGYTVSGAFFFFNILLGAILLINSAARHKPVEAWLLTMPWNRV